MSAQDRWNEAFKLSVPFIEDVEKYRERAYKDTKGRMAIGFGTQRYPNGRYVQRGDHCTEMQALDWLHFELNKKCIPLLDNYIKVPLTDHQKAALLSFAYNLGPYILSGSHLLDLINQKADARKIQAEIETYNHASGKVSRGLTKRRKAEAAMWTK